MYNDTLARRFTESTMYLPISHGSVGNAAVNLSPFRLAETARNKAWTTPVIRVECHGVQVIFRALWTSNSMNIQCCRTVPPLGGWLLQANIDDCKPRITETSFTARRPFLHGLHTRMRTIISLDSQTIRAINEAKRNVNTPTLRSLDV